MWGQDGQTGNFVGKHILGLITRNKEKANALAETETVGSRTRSR